jgi:hypothetical protein
MDSDNDDQEDIVSDKKTSNDVINSQFQEFTTNSRSANATVSIVNTDYQDSPDVLVFCELTLIFNNYLAKFNQYEKREEMSKRSRQNANSFRAKTFNNQVYLENPNKKNLLN